METKIKPLNYASDLLAEILDASSYTQKALAKRCGIDTSRLSELKKGTRDFSVEQDYRLTLLLGLSQGYFLRLQSDYQKDLFLFEKAEQIKSQIQPLEAA